MCIAGLCAFGYIGTCIAVVVATDKVKAKRFEGENVSIEFYITSLYYSGNIAAFE